MARWLFKSEPAAWSWADQVAAGERGTEWTGVRNHPAKLNLMAMQVGEQGFFYHSNKGKEIVGLVAVSAPYRPDPTDAKGVFGLVELRAVRSLPRPVTLAAVKGEPRLSGMALVTLSRLSVQPVTEEEWAVVLGMGGL
jgi:predicted RNA-binding protein with PUA-like domain